MKDRRTFLKSSVAAAVAAAVPARAGAEKQSNAPAAPSPRPNIIIYLADQFRWDFIGANGRNGSTRTPNLDACAARGKNFTHAITNQPVCAPARSVLMTSRYGDRRVAQRAAA
ncbi:MAG: sulfatase-like hydrolase/transferase [Candidatus Acidiferrales bacterium]